MTQVILDSEMLGRLYDLAEPLELCDNSGKILARVVPLANPPQFAETVPPLSREEVERRLREPEFTTSEVLARLESL